MHAKRQYLVHNRQGVSWPEIIGCNRVGMSWPQIEIRCENLTVSDYSPYAHNSKPSLLQWLSFYAVKVTPHTSWDK